MATKKFLDLDGLSRVWGKITNKFALKSIYGDSTINFGRKTGTTTGTNSVAAGYEATASGAYSHAEGYKTTASGGYSHAEGSSTTSSGSYSHAEGSGTTASSSYTHAEGLNSIAKGSYSHAEGGGTFARGNYSHTEGRENVSSGNNSHAEGFTNIAVGVSSHAEGGATAATVTVSGAANATTYTTSDTSNLRVDGYVRYDNTTSRITSITENTSFELATTLSEEALTDATVTIFGNVASGSYSHVEGQKTMANASSAHAEGVKTTASGNNSHVEGNSVIVQSKSQHAQGEYNIVDGTGGVSTRGTYADVVGNGTAEDARSNAYTLGWDGEGWFAGDVYTGSTSGTNKDAGSKKLATEDYVNTNYGKKISSIQSFFGVSSSLSTQPDRWTLPAGYQEIEYLQSTATEIINTDIDAIDVRKIECKFATMNYTGSQYITGARASNPNTILFAIDGSGSNTKFSALYNANSVLTTDIDRANGVVVNASLEISEAVDDKRTMTFKCNDGTYDETITKSNVTDLTTTGFNIHIFGWNTNNKTACRIYREKIYTDNGLVRDYVPCLNKITGKYGLYDMVENKFYTSNADFTFYGADAPYVPQLTDNAPYLWSYDLITYTDGTTQKNLPYVIEQKSESDTNFIEEPATEGTNGQVLTTDGNGGRSWTTVQGGGTSISGQKMYDIAEIMDNDKWETSSIDPSLKELKVTSTDIKDQLDEIKTTFLNGCSVQFVQATANGDIMLYPIKTHLFGKVDESTMKGVYVIPDSSNLTDGLVYFSLVPSGMEAMANKWLRGSVM